MVGQVAHVARPYAKGEVLLIGLDDSVSREEIIRAVAEVGKCTEDSIRTGPIRPMRNGLGMVWVQCPLATVNRLIEDGRLLVGWSAARVAPLRARPIQCFRCWRFGHARGTCDAPVDRGGHCFRCGKGGHQAKGCQEPFSCAVCAEDGKDSAHKIRTMGCANYANNANQGNGVRARMNNTTAYGN